MTFLSLPLRSHPQVRRKDLSRADLLRPDNRVRARLRSQMRPMFELGSRLYRLQCVAQSHALSLRRVREMLLWLEDLARALRSHSWHCRLMRLPCEMQIYQL